MFVHGIPALSLTAGVPANFIVFFIIGYIAHKNISLKQALAGVTITAVGLLIPALLFLPDFSGFTGLSPEAFFLTFGLTIILSLAIIAAVSLHYKEWRSYAIAVVVGQAIGAALLSVTVWAVSPFFLNYFEVPFAAVYILPLFVWTFATEIPFVLLLGPPIIKVCYRAFPFLRRKHTQVIMS
jgi:Kef-type K+ transport system membrane component KefB